jgi:hypothetical protein
VLEDGIREQALVRVSGRLGLAAAVFALPILLFGVSPALMWIQSVLRLHLVELESHAVVETWTLMTWSGQRQRMGFPGSGETESR